MYNSMYEADIQKFVDEIEDIFDKYYQPTYLQRIRKEQGLSQSQLALKSGVSLRVVQAYEQREKSIHKASVMNIEKIVNVLHCYIEDLMGMNYMDDEDLYYENREKQELIEDLNDKRFISLKIGYID